MGFLLKMLQFSIKKTKTENQFGNKLQPETILHFIADHYIQMKVT